MPIHSCVRSRWNRPQRLRVARPRPNNHCGEALASTGQAPSPPALLTQLTLKVAFAERGMIMSRLQLYTFQLCPFAHRVRLTLAEKRLAAELIEIDLKNKPAGFSKISPYGKVPLLQHGDVKIWESTIINEYLDEVFSD